MQKKSRTVVERWIRATVFSIFNKNWRCAIIPGRTLQHTLLDSVKYYSYVITSYRCLLFFVIFVKA